jgi:hypothetical protein
MPVGLNAGLNGSVFFHFCIMLPALIWFGFQYNFAIGVINGNKKRRRCAVRSLKQVRDLVTLVFFQAIPANSASAL